MQLLRRRLRPLIWIALVAMLGLGLLPAVSHALAWAGGSDDWAEVCTASGLTRVAAPGWPVEPDGLPATAGMEHCPYCALGAAAAGLPPPLLQPWLAPAAGLAALAAVFPGPALAAAWSAAQPRAPPASR